ncbi:hypothetical protein H4R20_003486 [Coemansia guatemalensis]|uniref:Uncharacterized protein n=1 Tax=Coemansia guatemalensis TaxID=2761395 RepID=A0A9W8LU07_9FUNG|nr:hypothetical protein H4R20_003486 [Coemansia guatemalensis]
MHGTAVAVAVVVAAVATVSCAAPFPQVDLAPMDVDDAFGPDGNGSDMFDPIGQGAPFDWSADIAAAQEVPDDGAIDDAVAPDAFLDSSLPEDAAPLNAPADGSVPGGTAQLDGGSSAGNPASNLVGNSLTQIDDSVNVSNTDIDYPGDSELTGNTGTAVSGNNNDIMPIINAPVTVIINSDHQDNSHNHPRPQSPPSPSPPSLPSLGGLPPPSLGAFPQQLPVPATQSRLSHIPGSATNGRPFAGQWPAPPLPNNPANEAMDPVAARIQQLVSHALAMSQFHV